MIHFRLGLSHMAGLYDFMNMVTIKDVIGQEMLLEMNQDLMM